MGTRGDFWVGTGPNAEWLGSIAYDAFIEELPEIVAATTEENFA